MSEDLHQMSLDLLQGWSCFQLENGGSTKNKRELCVVWSNILLTNATVRTLLQVECMVLVRTQFNRM